MPSVSIKLQPFGEESKAEAVASAIRDAGSISYIDASSGDTVNVTVGNVTVEN